MKLLHWSKQLHLDWAKVLPEGWKFLNWPAVIPVHRETFHKLTVGFCRLLVAKCSRNLLLNLVNRYFLMMCWLNFVMGCYDFLVFICLNKRMCLLTVSQQGMHLKWLPWQWGWICTHPSVHSETRGLLCEQTGWNDETFNVMEKEKLIGPPKKAKLGLRMWGQFHLALALSLFVRHSAMTY